MFMISRWCWMTIRFERSTKNREGNTEWRRKHRREEHREEKNMLRNMQGATRKNITRK